MSEALSRSGFAGDASAINQSLPCTGLVLSSTDLMPVLALQRAIETYLANRPELKEMQMARRSCEEAAQMLQGELLEKQAMHQSIHDELARL